MKRLALILSLFLVTACSQDEPNIVEYEPLEETSDIVGDDVEVAETKEIDDKEDEAPTGIVITGDRYTIQSGDTLSEIAIAAGVDIASIMRWNVIENVNQIFIGQEIVLTGAPVIEYADAVIANVVMDTNTFFQNGENPMYWNTNFLEPLDLRNLYLYFLRDGGEPRDIPAFAEHLAQNAPLLENWQDIAKQVYADLNVDAFEPVPGRLGYFYAINSRGTDVLVGIINARTGELER